MTSYHKNNLQIKPCHAVNGEIRPASDKSLSHRALILCALAEGNSEISNLLISEDTLATAKNLINMGVNIIGLPNTLNNNKIITHNTANHKIIVHGVGLGGLQPASQCLNFGNSGTSARLMLGVLTGLNYYFVLSGDASLSKRPMKRVTEPLYEMGLECFRITNNVTNNNCYNKQDQHGMTPLDHLNLAPNKNTHHKYCEPIHNAISTQTPVANNLPFIVHGAEKVMPINYTSPKSSAQVKSCLLLAGMFSLGNSVIREPHKSRDHSEKMLAAMGATITAEYVNSINPQTKLDQQYYQTTIKGRPKLKPINFQIPADPSAAAFCIVLAASREGSQLIIKQMLWNNTRIGFVKVLQRMGANIKITSQTQVQGENVVNLKVIGQKLNGTKIDECEIPSLIDEIPILIIAALAANSPSQFYNLAELRVKESDRLKTMTTQLQLLGLNATIFQEKTRKDNCLIKPAPKNKLGQIIINNEPTIQTKLDHRIAMSFCILACLSDKCINLDDRQAIDTSYPQFLNDLNSIKE